MALKEISEAEFDAEVRASARPVIVDFHAEWCGPCRMLGPELERIAANREDLAVVGVDVDKAPRLAADFGIDSIPAVMLFRNGQETARSIGYLPGDRLLAELGLSAR